MIPRPSAPVRVAIGLVCLSFVSTPLTATAQLTEKEVVKAFNSEVKSEIKDVKVAVKAAVATLDATLKALTKDAKDGTFGSIQETVFAEAIKDFEEAMVLGTLLQVADVLFRMDDLLPQLSPSGGIYPADFYFGSGSALGDLEGAILDNYEKALSKLDKRFAKLAKELEKNGIGFTWRLIFERRLHAISYNPGDGAPGMPNRLALSMVYAFSDLDTADDGRLCVIGFAPNTVSDIDIELLGGQPEVSVVETTVGEGDAILCHCFDNLGEGNYLIEVGKQGDSDSRFTSLGVR